MEAEMKKEEIKKKIDQMTLEEKALLCVGRDFWHLQGLERLGIRETMVTDGPHGLRKQEEKADHLGVNGSNAAICFPAGCALASSFDPALAQEMGQEIGKLAQAEVVSVVLGPAVNIKRSPLCGRNFEYYSEDPLVSSSIAAGTIKGIQSQNVGACPKHFLANNQERYRQTSNSVVDEQTLREIYLASFESAVREAEPWTMMCAYNRINGTYACENAAFLTDILRDEWGFDGYVMTDWGAMDDPVECIKAGLELGMPGPAQDNVRRIRKAVEDGVMEEAVLDRAVERILTVVFRYQENHKAVPYDFEKGHAAAARIESESAVLLKNEDGVLPLLEEESVALIGAFVKAPRYQGGGSSHINPYRMSSVWDVAGDKENVSYAEGFRVGADAEQQEQLLQEAILCAKTADKAVLFIGLPDSFETEGLDRKRLDLPEDQNRLVEAVAAVQPDTVVVLHNGSPVTMPWLDKVKGILELYLGGEAVGIAAADLIYGKVNPSGHLAESFPIRIEDTPTYPYYGVERDDVPYREGRLVGYRYYETMHRPVLFPFGHGLSYTEFSFTNLCLDKKEMKDTERLAVSVDVANTGMRAGKALVQIYVSAPRCKEVRPLRELRAFEKIFLAPGEVRTISLELSKRAFAEWNVGLGDWYVPEGEYHIQIGRSAADIILEEAVLVHPTVALRPHFTVNSPIGDIMAHPAAAKVFAQVSGNMMGTEGTEEERGKDMENSVLGKEAMEAIMVESPLRAMVSYVPGTSIEQAEQLVDAINAAVQCGKDE